MPNGRQRYLKSESSVFATAALKDVSSCDGSDAILDEMGADNISTVQLLVSENKQCQAPSLRSFNILKVECAC